MIHDSIHILYEDESVLVVNKPAGLVVHAAIAPHGGVRPTHRGNDVSRDERTTEPTLVDWLLAKYPHIKDVGDTSKLQPTTYNLSPILRSGIVHRLDRETSGVMVVAKTQAAFDFLKKQFQGRSVEKVYHAIVYGVVKKDEGVIRRAIGKSPSDFRRRSATRGARGTMREAVTEYKVLKRGREHTLLEVRPKTGRTHQIRVHLLAINHPVLADSLYAPRRPKALGMERTALHAKRLSLTLPSGQPLSVEAPYTEDFERAVAMIS